MNEMHERRETTTRAGVHARRVRRRSRARERGGLVRDDDERNGDERDDQ